MSKRATILRDAILQAAIKLLRKRILQTLNLAESAYSDDGLLQDSIHAVAVDGLIKELADDGIIDLARLVMSFTRD